MTQHNFHTPIHLEDVDPTVQEIMSVMETVAPSGVMMRAQICLSEALYNIVIHGTAEGATGLIDIALTVNDKHAEIEIYDPAGAAPFDITVHARDISEVDMMAENGRGLALIMECTDRVTYGPAADGRNRLLLGFDS